MLVLLCGTSAGLLLSAPRAPRTHRENIAAVLARHGVAFQSITFTQSFEESSELDFYRAQVQVYASDGSVASGWIGCEDRDRVCFLELRALGIVGERLPDLADDPFAPWLARAQAELKRLGLVR
jgi:hypothetical protein